MRVSVLKGFARHAVRPAVLIFSLVGMAAVSHSQTAATAAQSTTKAAVSAAAPEMATPTAQPRQSAATVKRQSGGNHEGIMVHGHWTIDVRNPDGKLGSHTEFENALQPQGADILTGLLSGEYVSGGFLVVFSTSPTPSLGAPGGSGLCGLGVCSLIDSRVSGYGLAQLCATSDQCELTYTPNPSSVAGDAVDAGGFTLSGTISNISSGGQIQSVTSGVVLCYPMDAVNALSPTTFLPSSPQLCGDSQLPPSVNGNYVSLTGATLPLPASGQCGGSGQPECAVTVTAGQSVSVSVQITFGSGATAAPGSASLPAAKSAK